MIRKLSLAALALACAASPAMSLGLWRGIERPHHFGDLVWPWIVFLASAIVVLGLGAYAARKLTLPKHRDWSVYAAGALIALVCLPAFAADVQVVADPAVTLPYGHYIVAVAELVRDVAVPLLTLVVTTVLWRSFPLARMFLSEELVERVVRKWLDFALVSVEGAAKDKTLSVPVGSAVVATGLQRAVDRADASALSRWALKEAGGPAEVAHKMFRMLRLEEGATAARVLAPAIEALPAGRRR